MASMTTFPACVWHWPDIIPDTTPGATPVAAFKFASSAAMAAVKSSIFSVPLLTVAGNVFNLRGQHLLGVGLFVNSCFKILA
jgi:hypothetical protein